MLACDALLRPGGEVRLRFGYVLRCDEVVRIPMAGFVASYNLQAAVASIASERFRQQQGGLRS